MSVSCWFMTSVFQILFWVGHSLYYAFFPLCLPHTHSPLHIPSSPTIPSTSHRTYNSQLLPRTAFSPISLQNRWLPVSDPDQW